MRKLHPMRKLHLAFLYSFLLLCWADTAFSTSILMPSLGGMVRQADTIVTGYFSSSESNVIFHVEASLKGKIQPFREIEITMEGWGYGGLNKLSRFVAKIQHEPCVILGKDIDGRIKLPWYVYSIWPQGVQGVSRRGPARENVQTCEVFVRSFIEYDWLLAQQDEDQLVGRLLSDLEDIKRRSFVLEYLDSSRHISNSSPDIFPEDKEMERDLMSIVAAHISSRRIYDDWSVRCMLPLASGMPQSIILPYFLEVAATGSVQSDPALSRVKSSLRGRRRTLLESAGLSYDPGVSYDLAALSGIVSKALPCLRAIDGRNNLHLFDARLDEVASAAPSVFSQIYDEPRPSGLSAHEEKRFWKNKVR